MLSLLLPCRVERNKQLERGKCSRHGNGASAVCLCLSGSSLSLSLHCNFVDECVNLIFYDAGRSVRNRERGVSGAAVQPDLLRAPSFDANTFIFPRSSLETQFSRYPTPLFFTKSPPFSTISHLG